MPDDRPPERRTDAWIVRSGTLVRASIPPRPAAPDEVTVAVHAIALNRGEIRSIPSQSDGTRRGWDVAGIVTHTVDGGPPVGSRVVGFSRRQEGWAESVCLPARDISVVPNDLTLATAACLPVAGLTALHCLELAGSLLGRRVVVTGASGGVGHFAVQLGHAAGATVIAPVRRAHQVAAIEALGAAKVPVVREPDALQQLGPVDVVVDGIGGAWLPALLRTMTPDGVAVTYAGTAGVNVTFNVYDLAGRGRSRLHGYNLYAHSDRFPASADLERLMRLVADGRIGVEIGGRYAFADLPEAVAALKAGDIGGKLVVTREA
jgi:NADPH:quinone reductase-like Zn-dependent oxidoreductase